MIEYCSTFLYFQVTQPKDKVMSHEIPGRLWKSIETGMFSFNNKHYLCVVDYHSKFLVIKQVEGFNTDNLIKHVRLFL